MEQVQLTCITGGNMREITCPFCSKDFEGEDWESGECPGCGEAYYWDECCTEDFSDCWEILIWEKFDGKV